MVLEMAKPVKLAVGQVLPSCRHHTPEKLIHCLLHMAMWDGHHRSCLHQLHNVNHREQNLGQCNQQTPAKDWCMHAQAESRQKQKLARTSIWKQSKNYKHI